MELTGQETRLDPAIRNDPFPFYRALREERPVYYDPGLDLYLVTRYDDAAAVLRDDVNFSLEHGYQDRYGNGFLDEFAAILERDGGGFIRDMAIDPPQHTRYRKLTEKAFTAHRVKDLEGRIRQIVVGLVEAMAARGAGDGMKDFGGPVTAQIICEQLGFDPQEVTAERIAIWTKAVLDQIGRMQTREDMFENAAVMCELQNYIIKHIRDRQANRREDMISDLVHARLDEGEDAEPVLSWTEQIATVRGFLIAGNDTTAAAIVNLLLVLATEPGLADRLHAQVDDDRVMTRFVEEVLRLQPPVHGLFRTAMNDVTLSGITIPAKAQVCIMYAAANHDHAKFADADALDIDRPNVGANLTFGLGIHRCVGIALARMEIKVAAQEIIRRLKDIKLAIDPAEITYLPTLATHTIERLPLTFARR
ncbi:cytochrome P450 [Novosphingobium sp. JCM 18896]|uniref:cytochrome P450 n=1 Tax=Novosphingobium sp. JCM 18896 TaxID=2989731 RepID=UPI0022223DA8|nr:cytochrome P450 [Novosphingobium sp. JCM 18896]MCW1427602.1 cytochrome P450 [Novosphingobium sp. JCM 18896]